MRFALAILLATAVPFGGDIVLAQDEDGCSKGPGPGSISTDSKWVSEFGSRRFVATYTNNSDQRIYATFCNQKRDDPTDEGYCGSDGIRPGGRTTWAHYEEQTTGEAEIAWVGSRNWMDDWLCSSRHGLTRWKPSWPLARGMAAMPTLRKVVAGAALAVSLCLAGSQAALAEDDDPAYYYIHWESRTTWPKDGG